MKSEKGTLFQPAMKWDRPPTRKELENWSEKGFPEMCRKMQKILGGGGTLGLSGSTVYLFAAAKETVH